ncbi:tRNA (adenosine(37)-N6)-threonylcarbamoyltransferase complex dimerization subunit type 1 TsaB [Marinicella meishanensis]|uniref:tRNA (adenosine(37)-N6)-threonylcarbamoyltransferase complex dimerization subunit type 1 TsaB n=1 Tax=Marinicella meishanensis TaxID=2873263 RepID=UPI001CBB004D|nr:tRNA (adenosine(37)-N6)-threonylcarbamoyltransferase complex dimerization subunit type 1 TsaB [Marinicella sp. NBU2979]
MNLIAIETATENCSVALLHQQQITHRTQVAPQQHAELVLGHLDELLADAALCKSQIDGIVFGQGPGAFTGVRIAMSIVQGLALALEVPVLPISTLANMAHLVVHEQALDGGRLLIANDARMGEIYWASFVLEGDRLKRLSEDALSAPEAVITAGHEVCAGSAFKSMLSRPNQALVLPEALPDASTLLRMAQDSFQEQATHINQVSPSYVREKVVFS